MHRMGVKGELTTGGVVTPILHACGEELESERYAPKWIDISHLTNTSFLTARGQMGSTSTSLLSQKLEKRS